MNVRSCRAALARVTSLAAVFRPRHLAEAARWLPAGVAAAAAMTALCSCHDTTSPGFAIAITAKQPQPPAYGTDYLGRPWLTCAVSLEAATTASGQAWWDDAVVYFYAINDRSTPFDSSVIPAETVRSSWGSELIGDARPQVSGWTLTAGIPFVATFVYGYQVVGGSLGTSRVSTTCQPAVQPGAAPRFTSIAIDSSTVLQPGGRLVVDYTVTSTVGLWATILHVSGPCDTTVVAGEPMLRSDTRTLSYQLLPTCSLGVPVRVSVTALDAALQSTTMAATLPALRDTVAPAVEVLLASRLIGYTEVPASTHFTYFVGDSIRLLYIASDNAVLHAIYWEVQPAGDLDSLVVDAPGGVAEYIDVPVRATWAGPIQLRFYARDGAGNTGQVLESSPGTVDVLRTVTLPVTRTDIGLPFGGIAWDLRRGRLYLNQGDWKKIGIFSRSAMAVTGTIQLADFAGMLDLTPGGDSLLVAQILTRSLAVVDLRTDPPAVSIVPLPAVDTTMTLSGLVVTANGKALITANAYAAGTGHLYTYDLATGAVQMRGDAGIAGQTGAGLIARSYDRGVAVLNGGAGLFQRYDAATDTFEPPKTARLTDLGPVLDGRGDLVTVGGDIYDSTLQYVLTPSVFHYRYQPIGLSPDGEVIYFSYGNGGNVRSRTADGTSIDHLQFPLTVNGLSASPDGSTLAVIQEASNGVYTLGFVTVPPLSTGAPVAHGMRAVAAAPPRRGMPLGAALGPAATGAPAAGPRWSAPTADARRATDPVAAAVKLLARPAVRRGSRAGR